MFGLCLGIPLLVFLFPFLFPILAFLLNFGIGFRQKLLVILEKGLNCFLFRFLSLSDLMCEGIYEPFLFRLQLPCSIARGELLCTGQKPVAIPPLFLVFQLSFSAGNIGRIRKIILVQCFDLGRLKIPRNAVFLHCFLDMGKLGFLRLDVSFLRFHLLALRQFL